MPFTFSHPAAVIPFAGRYRKYFSLTTLVIGSMMPDFEYFFRLRMACKFGHTPTGILTFDLPFTLIFAFVFHLIVRDPLIRNSPRLFYDRFSGWMNFNWWDHFRKNYFRISVSAVIGTASHILWDGFTHRHGIFAEHIPLLLHEHLILGHHFANYGTLQYASSLFGAIVIAFSILTQPVVSGVKRERDIIDYWFFAGMITFLLAMLFTFLFNPEMNYGNLLACFISSSMLGVISASLLFSRRKVQNSLVD